MKKFFRKENWGWIAAGILLLILVWVLIKNKKEEIKIVEPLELATIVRVVDGDTVVVRMNNGEESVRLIGVDTPEKGQCFEKEATEKMKEILGDKKVKLEADDSQNDKDKYGRILRYIYLDDGTFINKKLIDDGFGEEYTFKTAYKFQTEFREAQSLAKKNNLGMWAICEKK